MTLRTAADYARALTNDLADYHAEQLHGDEHIRNMVIIKMVALVTLAFDIPPTSDDPTIDYDDCIDRLRGAIRVLQNVD